MADSSSKQTSTHTSLFSDLDKSQLKKLFEKSVEVSTTPDALESLADFGESIAESVDLDWQAMTAEEQTQFTLVVIETWTQALSNFIENTHDKEVKKEFELFAKSGFNPAILQKQTNLLFWLDIFAMAFIDGIKKELES